MLKVTSSQHPSCHAVLLVGQGRAPATLCPSLGVLVVPQSRLSSVSCTARDHEPLGIQGGKERARAGGGKSDPALEEPASPFVVQVAAGGKEKPLAQLGMKKR